MNIKVLGITLRVELIIAAVVIGIVLWGHLVGSVSRITMKEGMQLLGASLDHKMGEHVKGSWDTKEQKKGPSLSWREHNHDSYQSSIPEYEGTMHFFANTEFKPECCASTYTSKGGILESGKVTGGGCACMSKEQIDYLNKRGGNRTLTSEF